MRTLIKNSIGLIILVLALCALNSNALASTIVFQMTGEAFWGAPADPWNPNNLWIPPQYSLPGTPIEGNFRWDTITHKVFDWNVNLLGKYTSVTLDSDGGEATITPLSLLMTDYYYSTDTPLASQRFTLQSDFAQPLSTAIGSATDFHGLYLSEALNQPLNYRWAVSGTVVAISSSDSTPDTATPEPTSISLIAFGLFSYFGLRRWRFANAN